jgi:membrane-associated protein
MGPWLYAILFMVIFAETGLIFMPFLPGDSLLFALGSLSAVEGGVSLPLLLILLSIAAISGDTVNYAAGRWLGVRMASRANSGLINSSHLKRTQVFYQKHGGKTIILARFLPIIRTYAPFVAGIGQMRYSRFAIYNISGGVLWISIFLIAGNRFGNLPQVKSNFQYVIAAIIVLSALPAVFEFIRARRNPSI